MTFIYKNFRTVLGVLALLSTLPLSAMAQVGSDGTRGGGDPVEQDFIRTGDAALQVLEENAHRFRRLNLDRINARWNSPEMTVIATDDILYDSQGNSKPATTSVRLHQTRINRAVWQGIAVMPRKLAYALHEILVLSEYERSGRYTYSAALFGLTEAELTGGRLSLFTNLTSFSRPDAQDGIERRAAQRHVQRHVHDRRKTINDIR